MKFSSFFYFIVLCLSSTFVYGADTAHASSDSALPQLDFYWWPSQIFWLIVVGSLFYMLIKNKALPQIRDCIHDREQKIADNLEDARRFLDEAKMERAAFEERLNKATLEAKKIREQARKVATDSADARISELKDDIKLQQDRFKSDIERQKANALKEIELVSKALADDIYATAAGKK